MNHAVDGVKGASADVLVEGDFVDHIFERPHNFLEGSEFHVGAGGEWREVIEAFGGVTLLERMEDALLGADDELGGGGGGAEVDDLGCAADEIGLCDDLARALRVYAEEGIGVGGAEVIDIALEEAVVGGTEAGPENHVVTVGTVDVVAE